MAIDLNDDLKREKEILEQKNKEKYWNTDIFWDTNHKIINNDSRKISKYIKNDTIDLIITSPPYYNAKSYSQRENIESYLKEMKEVFSACFKALKPWRKFCLNISDLPVKWDSWVKWIPLWSYLIRIMNDIWFELSDRIFWNKTPIKWFQYGSLPYPPSPLICDSIEYILIFRKPWKSDYSYLNKERKEASKLSRDEYWEYTKQIWTMGRVRTKDNINWHIAPYPEELPLRCIKLYSFVWDTILDPFWWSWTTSIVSANLKRNSILFELKEEYIKLIKDRANLNWSNLFIKPKYFYEK